MNKLFRKKNRLRTDGISLGEHLAAICTVLFMFASGYFLMVIAFAADAGAF